MPPHDDRLLAPLDDPDATLHYGPGDVRLAHGPGERVSLAETVAVARTLVLTALRSVGTE
jgi:acetylornithine deacetylase